MIDQQPAHLPSPVIFSERPTLLQFEQWIRDQPGSDTSPENIDRVNKSLAERTKRDRSRRKILEENGLEDDGVILDSIMLNDLDDWREIHEQLTPKIES